MRGCDGKLCFSEGKEVHSGSVIRNRSCMKIMIGIIMWKEMQ